MISWTGGHRPFVQGISRDYLKPSNYTFDIANNPEGENSFAFLRRLAQAERRGDSHSAIGWINSKVHVFDVLTGHIYDDISDFYLLHLGVHAVFIPD